MSALKKSNFSRIAVGVAAAAATAALLGITTDVIPNGWFTRMTPVRPFAVVVLILVSALTGALASTYVGQPAPGRGSGRAGFGAGALGWFAVGCPVCNKLVVGLLGTSGALHEFQPLQPALGAAAVALATAALVVRVRALRRAACPVPPVEPARNL